MVKTKIATLAATLATTLLLSACGDTVSLKEHSAALAAKAEEMGKLTSKVGTLEKEKGILKTDLLAEIARKNQLAVENTRLLGRVAQGQKDLGIVAGKKQTSAKVAEKPGAKTKKS